MMKTVIKLFFVCAGVLVVLSSVARAGAIKVQWDANSEPDLAGYKVYYGTASTTYSTTVDVGKNTSYVVANAEFGKRYYFAVTAYDGNGNESQFSKEVFIELGAPKIAAERTANGVRIAWQPIYGATGYAVYRDVNPYTANPALVQTVSDTQYVDPTFQPAVNAGVFYSVRAIASSGTLYRFPRVGGHTISLSKGTNLVSLPLVPSSDEINRVIGNQLTGSLSKTNADYIMMMKSDTESEIAWKVGGTTSPMEGKWVNEAGSQISSLRLPADNAFWVIRRETHSDSLITITGQVSPDSNRVIQLKLGVNYVGTCYPKIIDLTKCGLSKVLTGALSAAGADRVYDYDLRTYRYAWLVGKTNTTWDGKFMNESGSAVSPITFRPGRGFIVMVRSGNSLLRWSYPNPEFYN